MPYLLGIAACAAGNLDKNDGSLFQLFLAAGHNVHVVKKMLIQDQVFLVIKVF